MNPHQLRPGKCTLVGAGPGDPELLTLKAMKAIQKAEAEIDAGRGIAGDELRSKYLKR